MVAPPDSSQSFIQKRQRGVLHRGAAELRTRLCLGLTALRRQQVRLDRLLIGDQMGLPLEEWIPLSGEITRLSVPLSDSPYVQLLTTHDAQDLALIPDDALRELSYFQMARASLLTMGSYMNRVDEAGLLEEMRARREVAIRPPATQTSRARLAALSHFPLRARSGPGWPPLVNRVRDSEWFEIQDGHHRLAAALVSGATHSDVVIRGRRYTYLQSVLRRVRQVRGSELYQPIAAPEVSTWLLLRSCKDRFDRMRSFLASRGFPLDLSASVLDCACSYGWFVRAFRQEGLHARGIDLDPFALEVGRLALGLDRSALSRQELLHFLTYAREAYDYVLCLSLLHHFVMGTIAGNPAQVVARLSGVTRRVLFLDSGEEHEAWFGAKLDGWNADSLRHFLAEHGGFREVVALGRDDDAVGRNRRNYRRMLFACIK